MRRKCTLHSFSAWETGITQMLPFEVKYVTGKFFSDVYSGLWGSTRSRNIMSPSLSAGLCVIMLCQHKIGRITLIHLLEITATIPAMPLFP